MTDLTVLSLGGGWQSSALLLMSACGELPLLDAVVFADTQNEMPDTYKYLAYLRTHAEATGIKFIVATRGNLEEDIRAKAARGSQPTPPVRVRDASGQLQRVNAYTCSYDYKRRVVTAETKRLCGGRGAWKTSTVTQWIGYTRDEMSRMKQDTECRCGHKQSYNMSSRSDRPQGHGTDRRCTQCPCTEFQLWRVNDWPLIMRFGMTRNDCAKWLLSHNHPLPPRSACWHCPNRGNSHWRDLRDNKPDLWQQACSLDDFMRDGLNKMRGQVFIHQSGIPLRDADLRTRAQMLSEDYGQDGLFDPETDADCDAGVCFT